MMKSEWGSVVQCGTVWNCVESVEWGVEKFHTGALLHTNSVISPYLLRIYTIGIDTEQVRT